MNPMLRYYHPSARMKRTAVSIMTLYVLLNGSPYCIVFGTPHVVEWLWRSIDPFWAAILVSFIVIVLIMLAVPLIRRLRLAFSQMNLLLNGIWAFGIAAILVLLVVIAGKLITDSGFFQTSTYVEIAAWLWQIPVGVFIGRGLSWSIVDRRIAGVYATDDRELEEGFDG